MSDTLTITKPTIITGVQRKVNIGNFETVDVYCALALPVDVQMPLGSEELREVLSEVVAEGFRTASIETGSRYTEVKNRAS